MSFDPTSSVATQNDKKSDLENEQEEEERLKKIFRSMDTDGSGAIDAKELGDAMRLIGVKCTANSAKKVLKVIDTDGSGEIELDEFLTFFKMVKDPDELRSLLSGVNQKFMDYKVQVQSDPNFGKKFYQPFSYDSVATFDGHADSVERVEWIDGTTFLTASLDGTVKYWDAECDEKGKVKNKKAIRTIHVSDAGIYGFNMSADKKFAAIAIGTKTENVYYWNLDVAGDGGPVMIHTGHTHDVFSIALAPNKGFIASGGKTGAFMVHKVGTATPCYTDDKHEKVLCGINFSPDSAKLATGCYDGNVRIYEVGTGSNCYLYKVIEDAAATGWVFGGTFLTKDEVITFGDDFNFKVWDMKMNIEKDGPKTNFFGHTSDVTNCVLSPELKVDGKVIYKYGQFVTSCTADGSARVWIPTENQVLAGIAKDIVVVADEMQAELDEETDKDDMDAVKVMELQMRIPKINAQKEFLVQCDAERKSMECIQARACLVGHKTVVKGTSMRFVDDNCEVLTCSNDQSARLFRFKIPNINEYYQWTQGDGKGPPPKNKTAVQQEKLKSMVCEMTEDDVKHAKQRVMNRPSKKK